MPTGIADQSLEVVLITNRPLVRAAREFFISQQLFIYS
jgi:hypothetical protein